MGGGVPLVIQSHPGFNILMAQYSKAQFIWSTIGRLEPYGAPYELSFAILCHQDIEPWVVLDLNK